MIRELKNNSNQTNEYLENSIQKQIDYALQLISRRIVSFFIFGLFIWLTSPEVSAQSAQRQVMLLPSLDSIRSTNEELLDLTLKLVNDQDSVLKGFVKIDIPTSLQLISKNNIPVELGPGDSTFISIKIFVTKYTVSGKEHLIRFLLSDPENNLLASANSVLQVSVKRNVNMFALLSNILLDPGSDSIRVPIRIINAGNTAQKLTIISRYPSIFENDAFHATTQLELAPSRDTLITFTKAISRKMFDSEGFDVTFSGLYDNGNIFGMAYIKVQSARNERVYRDPMLSDTYNLNSITVSAQNMYSQNESYHLTGRGSLELPSGMLGYNLDMTSWRNSYSPAMARNTYVNFHNEKFGITAGNINKSMDINFSGRGMSLMLNDTTTHDSYEVGYVDANSNLFGSNNNLFFPSGNAAWGAYTHTSKDVQFSSSALYEVNPLLNSRSAILGNSLMFNRIKGMRILALLNAGHVTEYDGSRVKPGVASGLNINGTFKNLLVNSQNYYSSGYYPGLRKGALSFNERVTYLKDNSNIWGGVDYNLYQPKSLSGIQYIDPVFSTLRVEAGISGSVFKNLNVSLSPVYTSETNNSYQFEGLAQAVHSLESWNLNNTFNYAISNKQYLSINTETGIYQSTFDADNKFHFRANINYRNGTFNLSSTIQKGTFFLGEAASNFIRDLESPMLVNIVPSIQKSLFRNKLRTELGLAFVNSSFFGSSLYLTGRAELDVMPKTSFYTAINHNRYNHYNLSILEMGITQKLNVAKIDPKQGNAEIFVYHDQNQNNTFDEGDTKADGQLVYINQAAFIANASGLVEYKRLPFGDYKITVSNKDGWYAPEMRIVHNEKKTRIDLSLKQTGTLKGKVSYIINEFSYEINRNLQGLTVVAIDERNVRYITKTNDEGEYVFFLPIGSYALSIDKADLSPEVEQVKIPNRMVLDPQVTRIVNIDLEVKARQIETKKFISPNSPRKK